MIRLYGQSYRENNALPSDHREVLEMLEQCRTGALGGHLEKCCACGFEQPSYNSCNNRHCPKCQSLRKDQWLQSHGCDVLPVAYFHQVFTLPHDLNPLILMNKRVCLNLLFQAASQTLLEYAREGRGGLKGQAGFLAVLHTWSQVMQDHFHLHCMMPGGVLSDDGTRWMGSQEKDFLFPVAGLSGRFREKFLSGLKSAYREKKLVFAGRTRHLSERKAFYDFIGVLYGKAWVVYCKAPVSGPEVLEYLGRYVHRVALSNDRIRSVEAEAVTFTYRDRSDGNKVKPMTLDAAEFLRRFLLHVLPKGFMRIRQYGFLANRAKGGSLRAILGHLGAAAPAAAVRETVQERMLRLTGVDIRQCPRCKSGRLLVVRELAPLGKPYRAACRSP